MILSAQHRLLTTSHAFWQKTKFQPGIALLISIITDCNYLTSPYTPRGTWREMCFAKWSFYLCKTVQACSGVRLACVKPLEVVQVHASVSPVSSGAAVSNFMSCHCQLQGFFLVDNTPVKNLKLINPANKDKCSFCVSSDHSTFYRLWVPRWYTAPPFRNFRLG